MDVMGQTQITPLSTVINHFQEVEARANDFSMEVWKDEWQTCCSREWPAFNVGWPPEGTFDLPTIRRVRSVVSHPKTGYPDQLPYIIMWQDLVENPPFWLKHFVAPRPSEPEPIFALQGTERTEKKITLPSAPPYSVLQGGTEEELIFPPPYQFPRVPEEEPDPPPLREADATRSAGSPPHTRQRTQREQSAFVADSTVKTLPLRATGPPDERGDQPHHYWPFATSDLYNWKTQNPEFSERPAGLINLLDSIIFTHQPTWDDCQQLLQVLFTTEERERILNEARKLVPGVDGNPTTNQAQIDTSFPLTRPEWDFNTAEGKERLRVYRQALMGGLRAAARKPTNLAKVGSVQQEKDESPAAFLERIMEAFRTYTPMNPEAPESKAAVIVAFVNQSAADIRRKLQRIDRLGEKSLQDLLVVAEKVYNNREPPEDKQARRQTRDLARILWAATMDSPEKRDLRLRQLANDRKKGKETSGEGKWKLQKDQCAYCKKIGHWAQECPKRGSGKGSKTDRVKVLGLDELSD